MCLVPRHPPSRLLCALLLVACRGNLGVALPPQPAPTPGLVVGHPPAASSPEEALWPLLYAGPVSAAGQRARMLAWFAAMELSEAQLRGFLELARAAQAPEPAPDAEDAARLDAAYQALVDAYAQGRPDAEELAPLVARLAEGRRGPDPRQRRYREVYVLLDRAEAWAATLPHAQAERLSSCRFFLAASLGPLSTPGDYEEWLGTRWRGQDFGAFRAVSEPGPRRAMDIGGLWAEDGAGRLAEPTGRKLAVLVLLAAREPGVIEAGEVRLGVRAPGDYTPPRPPDPASAD